ncbi:MAG: hypothetical protein E6Q34_06275 [Burkholderiaceae bacterium]|nr:MAG: hypothetical protein E6Q34_06275 [Burkholderiaceae bacterium]
MSIHQRFARIETSLLELHECVSLCFLILKQIMPSQGNAVSKIYQWLVIRGQASIWSESSKVMLELDPEGSAYCVLSVQDAKEMAEIVANEARVIWDTSDNKNAVPARVEGDIRQSCKLWVESGVLQLVVHDSQPLVALINDSGTRVVLDITRAVALVQILQYMSETIEQRA